MQLNRNTDYCENKMYKHQVGLLASAHTDARSHFIEMRSCFNGLDKLLRETYDQSYS